jgi:hypothetical protein
VFVVTLRDGGIIGACGLMAPENQNLEIGFSNRPFGVKHFQTIQRCGVDVTRGLALLSGLGTKALPPWDSRTRRNDLLVGLAVK